MNNRTIAALIMLILSGCGREPSSLLRQGQLPIYDFPLYLSEGAPGQIWSLERDASKTLIASGLNDPRGIATDRYGFLYVAEYGAGRLLKIKPGDEPEVLLENLESPSIVAVDSFGEVYVTQDGTGTVMRASDQKVFATFTDLPTAFAFGVDDTPLIGLFDSNKLLWGWDGAKQEAEFQAPVNVSIDGTGRVYAADGSSPGKVVRYNQRGASEGTTVAENLSGPSGIAVDSVGNVFVVEQGAGRVILVTFEGNRYSWITDTTDPQYLSFTQY